MPSDVPSRPPAEDRAWREHRNRQAVRGLEAEHIGFEYDGQ